MTGVKGRQERASYEKHLTMYYSYYSVDEITKDRMHLIN